MRIKTQTEYAIGVLLYLAANRSITPGREMAAALGINETYMPRITHRLRDKRWISSEAGNAGGYRLSVSPKKITLLDVMAAMEDDPQMGCHFENRPLLHSAQDIFQSFQGVAEQYFSAVTIHDLLNTKDTALLVKRLATQPEAASQKEDVQYG